MDLKNINLMNDALFKAMMCHKNNRRLVVDFLHGVTGIEKEVLEKGTYIGGEEIPKRNISNKKQMTDLSILLGNKRRIIVEMNQTFQRNIFHKNMAYAFSVVIETMEENIIKYPKVILINIDDFNHFKTDKPLLRFNIQDEEGHIETEMYTSIHLVLANITNTKYNIDKEIQKFACFLKKTDLEEMGEEYEGDERYMAAKRTVKDLTSDPELIGYYDYEEERKRELAEEKIFAREDGLKEGLEEGARKQAIETAKKMQLEGLDADLISRCTGLSKEQISS